MRRFLTALTAAGLLTTVVAGTTLATTIPEGGITVECATNESGQVVITGTVTVSEAGEDFQLQLMGNTSDMGDQYAPITGQTVTISGDVGVHDYTFTLDAATAALYKSFRVDATGAVNDEKSRSFNNAEECGDIIPEAPLSVLILLSGVTAAGIFAFARHSRRQTRMAAAA